MWSEKGATIMETGRGFKDIEEQLRAVNPDLELYKCNYKEGEVGEIIVRFPSGHNIRLMQDLYQSGWTVLKEEVIGRNDSEGIKGWIPCQTGRKYLRMSGDFNCFNKLVNAWETGVAELVVSV